MEILESFANVCKMQCFGKGLHLAIVFSLTLAAKFTPTLVCQFPVAVDGKRASNFIRKYSAISATLLNAVTAFRAVSVAKVSISPGMSVGERMAGS